MSRAQRPWIYVLVPVLVLVPVPVLVPSTRKSPQ